MHTERRGYVLLAVIAVLVLTVTALATLSRLSMRRALAAADTQRQLQQRIGADSIERLLLSEARGVFDRLEKQTEQTSIDGGRSESIPRQIRGAVTLGRVTFDVLIADEDAKLNLNEVYHMTGPQRSESTARELVGPLAARFVHLRPATRAMTEVMRDAAGDNDQETGADPASDDAPEATTLPRAFRSWGEVFDVVSLSTGFGTDVALPAVTGEVTCWGSGGLNVRRASDRSFRGVVATVLSEAAAGRFVSRYKENPGVSLEILIQQEAKTETQRIRLRRMLAESSSHFSLWIDASTVSRRSHRTFSVLHATDQGVTMNERFAF